MKEKWNVLSPDGISVHFSDTYSNKDDAIKAFEKWRDRFKIQGYYSSAKFGRIPLDELDDFCELIRV